MDKKEDAPMPQISEKEEGGDEGQRQTLLSYEALQDIHEVLQDIHGEEVLSMLRGLYIRREEVGQNAWTVKESKREVKAQKPSQPSINRLKDLHTLMPKPPLRPPTRCAAVDQTLYRQAQSAHKECISACKSAIFAGSDYIKGRFTLSDSYYSSHFHDTFLASWLLC
jgi:hypothetical protein